MLVISVVIQMYVLPACNFLTPLTGTLQGGLEFLTHSTTLSSPFDKYRPSSLPKDLPDVQIMAVDILPTAIPFDASVHFSGKLYPYLESVIEGYRRDSSAHKTAMSEYGKAVDRATIATAGKLVGKHVRLGELVDQWRNVEAGRMAASAPQPMGSRSQDSGVLAKKKVLMLGSGMVAGPAVDKIASRKDVQLMVGECPP